MMQGLLSQYCHIVGLLPLDGDIVTGVDTDSIDMKGWDHCCMIFIHSATVTGNSVFTVNAGATDGVKTAAIYFTYRYGGAAIKTTLADVYSAPATKVATLTLTNTTYQGRVFIVEVDAADMQSSGTQYRYLTANFDGTASAGDCAGIAILTKGRYMKDIMATVIA